MKLNIGCGSHKLEGFVNLDSNAGVKPDHLSDCRKLAKNFSPNSVEEIHSYHMIEHLCRADALRTLNQCLLVLVPGGRLYLELPEFDGVLREYLRARQPKPEILKQRIFGMQRNQFDFHLWGYSFADMRGVLQDVGFKKIKQVTPSTKHGGPCFGVECFK